MMHRKLGAAERQLKQTEVDLKCSNIKTDWRDEDLSKY